MLLITVLIPDILSKYNEIYNNTLIELPSLFNKNESLSFVCNLHDKNSEEVFIDDAAYTR